MTPAPETMDRGLLELYLNDHLTGATAGLSRAQHMVRANADLPIHAGLRQLAQELAEEHDRLRRLIHELGLTQKSYRQLPAKVGEVLGRLKLNGRLLRRSPMTPILEVELLRGAVNTKAGLWELLAANAGSLGLDPAEWEALARQAGEQSELLAQMHSQVVALLTPDG